MRTRRLWASPLPVWRIVICSESSPAPGPPTVSCSAPPLSSSPVAADNRGRQWELLETKIWIPVSSGFLRVTYQVDLMMLAEGFGALLACQLLLLLGIHALILKNHTLGFIKHNYSLTCESHSQRRVGVSAQICPSKDKLIIRRGSIIWISHCSGFGFFGFFTAFFHIHTCDSCSLWIIGRESWESNL